MAITPTIGRNVYYTPKQGYADGDGDITSLDGRSPCLAFITYVHSDTRVNLLVLDHLGATRVKNDVQMVQPEEPKPDIGGFAYWMPYQVGKAGA